MTTTAPEPEDGPPWSVDRVKPQPAVRWLSPDGLALTARQVVKGTMFARYADKRESEADTPSQAYDLTYLGGGAEAWLDFVADTGDGFDATYTLACSVTRATGVVAPPLTATPLDECLCQGGARTGPGDLLVLGGDQVYPVAGVRAYDERFKHVFRTAAEAGDVSGDPYVVAIPGNHDWYDGLVSFRRNFCESWVNTDHTDGFLVPPPDPTSLDKIGRWRAFQSRSYYAALLPHRWWLWGVDMQLDAPIDAEQLAYFRRAAALLEDDDRIILVWGRPSWTDPAELDDRVVLSDRQNLCWFLDRILGSSPEDKRLVRLLLSGDKHHYTHYTPTRMLDELAPELVTCGGGGAFLSSTHHLDQDLELVPFENEEVALALSTTRYELKRTYPSREVSLGLRKHIALIPFRNGRLPLLVGAIYLLLLWGLAIGETGSGWPRFTELRWAPDPGSWEWSDPSLTRLPGYLPVIVLATALVVALVGYARFGAKAKPGIAAVVGMAHALAHLALVYAVSGYVGEVLPWPDEDHGWAAMGEATLAIGLVVVGALLLGFVGAGIFAAYLWVCDLPGVHLHELEAFSGLRHTGYKCHLRIHLTKDALHVRAIGIDAVPSTWQESADRRFFVPGGASIASREIDSFVVTRN